MLEATAPIPDLCEEALNTLLVVGTKLVRDLGDQDLPATEKVEPYERLSRAVRFTVMLARKPPPRPQAERDSQTTRTVARQRLIRSVEDAIETGSESIEHAETLREELQERLEDLSIEFDILNRPIEDVILEICRDLGLANNALKRYTRRYPADVKALLARAAALPKLHDDAPRAEPPLEPEDGVAALLRRNTPPPDE